MTGARKARLEGVVHMSDVVLVGLAEIVTAFKTAYPAEWDELRLCPLQHGLDAMIERMGHS